MNYATDWAYKLFFLNYSVNKYFHFFGKFLFSSYKYISLYISYRLYTYALQEKGDSYFQLDLIKPDSIRYATQVDKWPDFNPVS